MKNEIPIGKLSRNRITVSFPKTTATLQRMPSCRALEPKTIRHRTGAHRVFNQANPLFPNDFFEMTRRMIGLISTKIAFQSDGCFPYAVFVTETSARNPVDVAGLERCWLIDACNFL